MKVRLRRSWLALAIMAAGPGACAKQPSPTPAFVFERPEHVEFVCVRPEQAATQDDEDELGKPAETLPLACCAADTPLHPTAFFGSEKERAAVCGSDPLSLHALVTQSARGEVAAVDLRERRVLDSDALIPGFTFIDVGGLPRALVTPPHKPGDGTQGPPFSYVASAEDQSLVAVPNCRFRGGCPATNAKGGGRATKVALPADPRDMAFVPEDALWVSLPSLSAVARIPLDTEGSAAFGGEATFHRVPVVRDLAPNPPVPEAEEYVAWCGLGYEVDLESSALTLPVKPPASGTGVATPTRVRFDATSGLLFVADATQPVIHAFVPGQRGPGVFQAIATGAPIRDFALTEAVPKVASNPRRFAAGAAPTFAPSDQRYLYAIDDRDGSVLVHSVSYANGALRSQALALPAARERADRLELGRPALSVEIVDNRPLTNTLVCDWGRHDRLEQRAKGSPAAAETAELDLLNAAGPLSMRGVFAAITTLDGQLAFVDIHDLDLFCRGERWCESDVKLSDEETARPVAIRRHTLRIVGAADADLTLSPDPAAFEPLSACAPGQYSAAQSLRAPIGPDPAAGSQRETLVCSSADPWLNSYNPGWVASWEGELFRGTARAVEVQGDRLVLEAAPGVDLCERGVVGATPEVEPGYAGDWLVLTGTPPSYAPLRCTVPELGDEPHFRILEAYGDRLVAEAKPARGRFDPGCFPDVVAFEVRARERFLVQPGTLFGLSAHRVIAGADGRCAADPDRDPRLVSRAEPGKPFSNAFASLAVAAGGLRGRDDAIVATARGTNTPFFAPIYPVSQNTPPSESLPASLRYLNVTGSLYVVDMAQGLRRFALAPFAADPSQYR